MSKLYLQTPFQYFQTKSFTLIIHKNWKKERKRKKFLWWSMKGENYRCGLCYVFPWEVILKLFKKERGDFEFVRDIGKSTGVPFSNWINDNKNLIVFLFKFNSTSLVCGPFNMQCLSTKQTLFHFVRSNTYIRWNTYTLKKPRKPALQKVSFKCLKTNARHVDHSFTVFL